METLGHRLSTGGEHLTGGQCTLVQNPVEMRISEVNEIGKLGSTVYPSDYDLNAQTSGYPVNFKLGKY